MQLSSSSTTAFNKLSNWDLELKVHIYTGCHYVCSPVLAQQKPHPYNKCKVLSVSVFVHWWECVGVSGGGEGVKYLPLGYDNVTQGRQHAPKQLQTCQNRKGFMA